MQLKRAMGGSWSLRPSTKVWMYEAILKSRLTYAALTWDKRISKKTAEAMLDKIRRLVLRGAIEAVKSIPTSALGTLLGIGLSQNS